LNNRLVGFQLRALVEFDDRAAIGNAIGWFQSIDDDGITVRL
jgi:hypothetical protein